MKYTSLRVKIMLFLFLIFVFDAGITVYEEYQAFINSKKNKTNDLVWIARWIAAEERDHFRQANGVAILAENAILRGQLKHICPQGIVGVPELDPEFGHLAIAAPDGTVSCNSIPWLTAKNVAAEDYFKNVLPLGAANIAAEVDYDTPHQYFSVMVHAMRDSHDRLQRVILVAMDFSWVMEEVDVAQLPKDSHLLVIDGQGTVIAGSRNVTNWVDKNIADTPFYERVQAHQEQPIFEAPGFTNQDSLVVANAFNIGQGIIQVITDTPTRALLSRSYRNITFKLLDRMVVLILMLLAVYYWSDRYLLRKIAAIQQAAQSIAGGNLFTKIQVKGRSELADLANSFNNMAESLQAAEKQIWKEANIDLLTGLPNRRLFYDRLGQEIMRAELSKTSTAVLFMDLDKFKDVNDTIGHAQGDKLLKEAARRILECVHTTDTVARWGGDEFAIILPNYGERVHIERIADEIVKTLSNHFALGDDMSYLSVSIGIALYPDEATDSEELIKHADQAMYSAKDEGGGRYNYFAQSMQTEAREKQALTKDLRHALSRHELEVYYQPIADMSSGQIHKAEALLRWKHPVRGMVSPVTFIPLAEESGLILEIGNWVFDQVITQIQHWNQLYGYIMEVSVNMSPRQFEHDSTNIWVERLSKESLPKKCIVVEITEGLLIKDSAKVKQRLEEFHLNGIDVSIDDFGTGFSALSYLKQFDIDYLKIDRSFVMNLTEDESDKALVKAIITMAHSLEIKTIAEGVETEAQRDILIGFGCDYVQGYLYSRPVPAVEFDKLLEV
jgi:diguanylate cyclase (GGDEF)-like protein